MHYYNPLNKRHFIAAPCFFLNSLKTIYQPFIYLCSIYLYHFYLFHNSLLNIDLNHIFSTFHMHLLIPPCFERIPGGALKSRSFQTMGKKENNFDDGVVSNDSARNLSKYMKIILALILSLSSSSHWPSSFHWAMISFFCSISTLMLNFYFHVLLIK